MTKKPFITKGYRAKKCLELMYHDVCGPFNFHACKEYEYFITFIDNYSRFGYIYVMHRKFDAVNELIEFKEKLENQLGKISWHFDLIKVVIICLASLIISLRSVRSYPS